MPTSVKQAIVSVTNDLTTDQRVNRTCLTLEKAGYHVMLIGRRLRNSKPLAPRSYRMDRMRLLFDKGPLFYAEYNLRLFLYLLFHRYDLIISNDLDTLPANYLANLIKHPASRNLNSPTPAPAPPDSYRDREGSIPHPASRIPDPASHVPRPTSSVIHLHDCHEYFRGVPELVGRKSVTRTWKWIEDHIFPKLKHVIAVNQSIAGIYSKEYGNKIEVIRNVPFRKSLIGSRDKATLNIRPDQKIVLYQGAVNVDRGLEEAILAMKYLESDAILVIAGIGDIFESLKKFTIEYGLDEKVIFLGQVPFQELHSITLMADLGLSIEKNVSINYLYCLPNKFLDYIQANVPVLVSPFPEMKAIVDQYNIGEYLETHDPVSLAEKIDSMLKNPEKMSVYKKNLIRAASELCWELEEERLLEVIHGR